jgi:hypothetical protein
MNAISRLFDALPPQLAVAIVALTVVQVSLQVVALVDLGRRTAVAGGRKWVWALVIVAGAVLGVVAYLALGRLPNEDRSGANEVGAGGESATRRALDQLYGPDDRS